MGEGWGRVVWQLPSSLTAVGPQLHQTRPGGMSAGICKHRLKGPRISSKHTPESRECWILWLYQLHLCGLTAQPLLSAGLHKALAKPCLQSNTLEPLILSQTVPVMNSPEAPRGSEPHKIGVRGSNLGCCVNFRKSMTVLLYCLHRVDSLPQNDPENKAQCIPQSWLGSVHFPPVSQLL